MTGLPAVLCTPTPPAIKQYATSAAKTDDETGDKMTDHDTVNHPQHYTCHPSGVECIKITRHMNFNLGNVYKYVWRAGLKSVNPIEDLEKAAFYIQDEISRL